MNDLDPGGFVSTELDALFRQRLPFITHEQVENCGLMYIQDVDLAPEYAHDLATKDYAPAYDYVDDGYRFVLTN
jgi:hypothetical protein